MSFEVLPSQSCEAAVLTTPPWKSLIKLICLVCIFLFLAVVDAVLVHTSWHDFVESESAMALLNAALTAAGAPQLLSNKRSRDLTRYLNQCIVTLNIPTAEE